MQVGMPTSLLHFSDHATSIISPPMTHGSELFSLRHSLGLGVSICGASHPWRTAESMSVMLRFWSLNLGEEDAHLGHLKEVRIHSLLYSSHPRLLAEVVRPEQAEVIVRVAVVKG